MPNLVSTLAQFKMLLQECEQVAALVMTEPNKLKVCKEQVLTIRKESDEKIQAMILRGIFPATMTELDILRKQYLDLSKELFEMRQAAVPSFEMQAITNVMNTLLIRIKEVENVDPLSLMLD